MEPKEQLINIILALSKLENPSDKKVQQIFRRFPKNHSGLYSKSEILAYFNERESTKDLKITSTAKKNFLKNIRMKETRTISGVTPVTVLTKPYPCPGTCIFCPNDIRMPKSYLFDEPGAQRAYKNKFDPYAQTYNRLLAYKNIGHPTDKVELIILGGTWTSYPEPYQIWFIKRCFDAMNDFQNNGEDKPYTSKLDLPYSGSKIKDTDSELTYNQLVSQTQLKNRRNKLLEEAEWDDLFQSQRTNETAKSRCVGLVIETRPDEITKRSAIQLRKLGATKIQIGFQSLNDKVLKLNKRGHDVKTTRETVSILRQTGFKIHAHWMPNLYGSDPDMDIKDFKKMFNDKNFRPDELKIYPCSLIAGTSLMDLYKTFRWKPYTEEELLYVLKECIKLTPPYCRITRMVRDIGSQDIVAGNKKTNFRQIVEAQLKKEGAEINEIRSREIRSKEITESDLYLKKIEYETSTSREVFLEYVTKENEIAGYMRLSLPTKPPFIVELKESTIIREIHIYGQSIEIGKQKEGKAQHLGLGKKLIQKALQISKKEGYKKLTVISSVGTREYYRKNNFKEGKLYQFIVIK
ncbi:hypothetical protein A2982_04015 [candidate division WWE3 bacterium RIFCSPLOWO2_01_FULL_39_13]|uniref:Elongator complex protein 3 n=1 Tax=candidate division WWE3 bacterium RIFCSPLOWO2_01_FULL_39_13 TaxID=1802624 RepID=A0A1F4V251_UNCKA|nr:MAG: hypothetical protein A2982_04015 [candidate division WWE3 bacterium RIFCSPLOWO2_01_FULL_39_13]